MSFQFRIAFTRFQLLAVLLLAPLGLSNCAASPAGNTSSPIASSSPSVPSPSGAAPISPPASPGVPPSSPLTPPSPASATASPEAAQTAEPKAVVDRFYKAYIFDKKSWEELKADLDPATYQQLKQVKQFDADPFIDAQVSAWEYEVGNTTITGDTAKVGIRLKVGLRKPPKFNPEMTVVLKNNQGLWQIRNIIYSPNPLPSGQPYDLLTIWK